MSANRMPGAVESLRKLVDGSVGEGLALPAFLGLVESVARASEVDCEGLRRAFVAAHGDRYRIGLAAAAGGAC